MKPGVYKKHAVLWFSFLAATWGCAQTVQLLRAQAVSVAAQARELAGQMEELDQHIEQCVQRIIDYTVEIKDSPESGTRVVNMKQSLMEGLANSIQFYEQQRAGKADMLSRPISQVPKESLAADVEDLDTKINDRIDQILQLSASLTSHTNFKKYEVSQSTRSPAGRYRTGGTSQHVSKDYRQSKREGGKAVKTTETIVEGLEQDIDRLQRENTDLDQQRQRTASQPKQQVLDEAIEANDQTIATREGQIEQAVSGGGAAPAKALGSREAHTVEMKVREEVDTIRTDFDELVRLKSEYDLALGRLKSLQSRLSLIEQEGP